MIGDLIPSDFHARLDPEGKVRAAVLRGLVDRVARRIGASGARPGGAVSIEGSDPFGCLVGMLAAWRNGCVAVPLHPLAPAARTRYMRETAQVTHRLTIPRLRLDPTSYEITRTTSRPAGLPDNLAYILFTSGSTGLPKGVLVSHRALEQRLTGFAEVAGIGQEAVIATLTNPIFDISLAETLLPLIVGCGLVTPPAAGPQVPSELAAWLQGSGATIVQGTPTLIQLLRAAKWRPSARQVLWSAGEALPGPIATWARECGAGLWNLYGPTETVIYATAWQCTTQITDTAVMPIGKCLPGTSGRLLPVAGQQLNGRAVGELAIGGGIVASGYISENGVVQLPTATVAGQRLYRTGDLCSADADGTLRYLGRLDDQVKVRGYRIELGEVEASALRCTGVMRCAAFTMTSGGLEAGKLAIALAGADIDIAKFRQELKVWLPDYMIPTAVFVRADLPVTATGKTDRQKIAAEIGASRVR